MDILDIDSNGWCAQARRVPSPNFDARPDAVPPELLVIHNISLPAGSFGGPYIEALFTNMLDCEAHPSFADLREMRVSAHFLIRRDGELVQFVSASDRAWHAGLSVFEDRERCNDFSIGIELEGSDETEFAEAQYESLAVLTRALCLTYPVRNIVGHQDIAPGRKTDPGPFFDWRRYRSLLKPELMRDSAQASFQGLPKFPFINTNSKCDAS
jgi:AmpD protein